MNKIDDLYLAIQNGENKVVEDMIKKRFNVNYYKNSKVNKNIQLSENKTPLMYATEFLSDNSLDIIDVLIDHGASILAHFGQHQESALFYCAKFGSANAMSLLIKRLECKNKFDIDMQAMDGKTLTHCAAMNCNMENIDLLSQFKPNFNILDMDGNSIMDMPLRSKLNANDIMPTLDLLATILTHDTIKKAAGKVLNLNK